MIVVNFKNYKTGKDVLKFAKKISDKCFIACVPSANISEVSKNTKLIVYAQHVDSKKGPRNTGYLTAKAAKEAGAIGTLLNHSEHQISFKELKETVKECNKQKLKIIVCVKTIREAKKVSKLNPYAIAYEDPKLIATKKSIMDENPFRVLKFVRALEHTKIFPLCGAGINRQSDVDSSIRLGCKGVLISSKVMKSKNPKGFLNKVDN